MPIGVWYVESGSMFQLKPLVSLFLHNIIQIHNSVLLGQTVFHGIFLDIPHIQSCRNPSSKCDFSIVA